jgi:hypothetical protein
MRGAGTTLRLAGTIAVGIGYVAGLGRRLCVTVWAPLIARRRWRTLETGALRLSVPLGWGDVEPLESGGFVVHNRARRYRVEGDAVWYGSAIELMLGPPDPPDLPSLAPMREHRRSIMTPSGPIAISLRIANGVSPRRRREALRVLRSIGVVG